MKLTVLFFVLLSLQLFSQEKLKVIDNSKTYEIEKLTPETNKLGELVRQDIKVINTATNKVVFEYNITDFEDALVTVNLNEVTDFELDNVQNIFKLEIEYNFCISNVESYFVLETQEKTINLPSLMYSYQESPNDYITYDFSKKNTIKVVKSNTEKGSIFSTNSYFWDGKQYFSQLD